MTKHTDISKNTKTYIKMLRGALGWGVTKHTDISKNTKTYIKMLRGALGWGVTKHTDISKNTKAYIKMLYGCIFWIMSISLARAGVSQNTRTTAKILRFTLQCYTGVFYRLGFGWFVTKHTDTIKNAKAYV